MRGALEPLEGVATVDTVPGRKTVFVACDLAKVGPEDLLDALEKAGEGATVAR